MLAWHAAHRGVIAIAVPLAETMLAGWLLSQARIASPEGEMTVAPATPKDRITVNADGTLSGRARGVPFAKEAKHIAALASACGDDPVRPTPSVEEIGARTAAQQKLLREMKERDERDRNRAESPLRPAADAVILDSTSLTLEQVLERAEEVVRSHLPSGDL